MEKLNAKKFVQFYCLSTTSAVAYTVDFLTLSIFKNLVTKVYCVVYALGYINKCGNNAILFSTEIARSQKNIHNKSLGNMFIGFTKFKKL